MRLVLIRLSDDVYQFVWSHHHLLLDGWSLSLVLREAFDFYEAFCRGANLDIARPRPFREYIACLEQQSKSKAEGFWREHLKGFSAPTPLRVDHVIAGSAAPPEEYSDRQTSLSEQATAALLNDLKARGLLERTLVIWMGEFGRTPRINLTAGRDHYPQAFNVALVGAGVKGGRVIADWPGLKPANLYEGRDLAPTTDLRAALKGILRDHLGVSEDILAKNVFPDSAIVKPMQGLVA